VAVPSLARLRLLGDPSGATEIKDTDRGAALNYGRGVRKTRSSL